MKWTIFGWLIMLLVSVALTLTLLITIPDAPAETAPFPQAGEWMLTMNPNALASCLNRRTFQLPTERFISPIFYTSPLSFPDGDSFQFRDDVFTRIPGTNRFIGMITLDDGVRAQIQFNLVTPHAMTGQLVTSYRVDTTYCSQTIRFTFERAD